MIVGESGRKWRAPDRAGALALMCEVEQMFLGQFCHNLDEKGRITIPARFRDLLAVDGAYVVQGFDRNLMVLPSASFTAISNNVNKMSMTDPTARLLRRLVFSSADRVEVDKAGRILLPQFLRQAAGLEDAVYIVGNGDYFEIWSPDQWALQTEQINDAQVNAHRFSAFDITSE